MTEAASPVLEFWYEFASTYSYPAAMRAEAVAAERGVRIAWKPFLLGPIFREAGWSTSPFNVQPAKGAYMWRDLERICARTGLAFVRPDPFPQNGLLAARIATALPDDGRRSAFSRAVYALQFGEGAAISDRDRLSGLVARLGHAPEEILKAALPDANKSELRVQTDQARAHAIFGAPTWRTFDGELFWGNDRLEEALTWLA